jgi:hypothetical protein
VLYRRETFFVIALAPASRTAVSDLVAGWQPASKLGEKTCGVSVVFLARFVKDVKRGQQEPLWKD